MIESNIYDSILEDNENNIVEYIAEKNRSRSNPLTTNALKVTFFKYFISPPPLEIELEKSDEYREMERKNLVKLLNIFTLETLNHKWNPDLNDEAHKKTERLYSMGSIKAVVKIFKDVVAQVLNLYSEDERKQIFFRPVSIDSWEIIRGRLTRLLSHKIWTDPSIEVDSSLKVNDENLVKKYLNDKGLTVNWILGGSGD